MSMSDPFLKRSKPGRSPTEAESQEGGSTILLEVQTQKENIQGPDLPMRHSFL